MCLHNTRHFTYLLFHLKCTKTLRNLEAKKKSLNKIQVIHFRPYLFHGFNDILGDRLPVNEISIMILTDYFNQNRFSVYRILLVGLNYNPKSDRFAAFTVNVSPIKS